MCYFQMVGQEIQLVVLNRTFPKLKRDAGYIIGESYFADNKEVKDSGRQFSSNHFFQSLGN